MKKIIGLVLAFIGLLSVFTGCRPRRYVSKKPVIYVYPEKKQKVSINLDFNGTLRATYPLYKNNWEFMADTDGSLTDLKTGEHFQYLFYDGYSNADYTLYKNGFCIKTDTVVDFLKHTLAYIGLNEKERNDMISFWLPELNANEFAFIHFRLNNGCNDVAKLKISPRPDTEIRVMLEFKGTDSPFPVKEQQLFQCKRKGFTVIEWGGVNLDEILPAL
jgi:hypothetical protein